jgi:hypothetical protein
MLLNGERAMTVEIKTDPSRNIAMEKWTPKSRRQGEAAGWEGAPRNEAAAYDELPLAPSRPVWPRVFPGS